MRRRLAALLGVAVAAASALGAMAPWVNNPQQLLIMRPSPFVVDFIGDSISVGQMGAFQQGIYNYAAMVYGDRAPTFNTHGVAGITIEGATTNGQLSGAIADHPDVYIIELGINDIFNPIHPPAPNPTRAYIASVAGVMLSTIRAADPTKPIAWSLPLISGGEEWSPPATSTPPFTIADIVNGIKDACVTYGAQIIDANSTWLAEEQILNPTQQPFGVLSLEGTHPNWRGRPYLGQIIVNNLIWTNKLFSPDAYATPSYAPDADVGSQIALWIDAAQCSPGPISSIGRTPAGGVVATFATFPGATSPTCVPNCWFNGGNCVRFNGTSDVMTASLTLPAGPKTLYVVYKVTTGPATFGTWYSLLTVKGAGSTNSEFAPYANSSWGPVMAMFDQHANGSDGFKIVNTNGIADSTNGNIGYPIEFSAQWAAGGTGPTDITQYRYLSSGYNITPLTSSSGFLAQAATCLTALGAKIEDGVTPTMYARLDLAEMLLVTAIPSTVQDARINQYLRRKWGP